jgi:RNA-directed DNA polymerase
MVKFIEHRIADRRVVRLIQKWLAAADDFVMGFQYEADAVRFRADLQRRLTRFGLEVHPDKTRLLRFGRFADAQRRERGEGKLETFNFLGFTHICGKTRSGTSSSTGAPLRNECV